MLATGLLHCIHKTEFSVVAKRGHKRTVQPGTNVRYWCLHFVKQATPMGTGYGIQFEVTRVAIAGAFEFH